MPDRLPSPETGDLASLLVRAGNGDESAWRELIGLYGRRVYAMARSRCRRDDIAEEIAQSVFATVAAKLTAGEYVEQGRFESWLFRVTMNRVRDEARRRARHAEPTDPEMLGQVAAAPADSESARPEGKELDTLRDALKQLGEADREVVELRHHGGLSFQQISAVLEEPLGTVLARHHRALRKLKDLIEGSKKVPS
jgi:RNA polymerase sigma-70 factor (ECF subfamily)